MTDAQRDAVRPGTLAKFLAGPMGLRLRRAETVRREVIRLPRNKRKLRQRRRFRGRAAEA